MKRAFIIGGIALVVFILASQMPRNDFVALLFAAGAFVAGYSTRYYQGVRRDVCWGLMWGGIMGATGIMAVVLQPLLISTRNLLR